VSKFSKKRVVFTEEKKRGDRPAIRRSHGNVSTIFMREVVWVLDRRKETLENIVEVPHFSILEETQDLRYRASDWEGEKKKREDTR